MTKHTNNSDFKITYKHVNTLGLERAIKTMTHWKKSFPSKKI